MKLEMIIDRFEGDFAVLTGKNNFNINWPRTGLPEASHEGSAVIFEIELSEEAAKRKKKEAKDLLNEILTTE